MPGIAERCKGRDRRTVRTANPLSGFGLMGLGEGEQVRLLASSVTSRSIGLRRSETTNRERGLHAPFFDPESHFVIRHCYSNLHLRGREKSPLLRPRPHVLRRGLRCTWAADPHHSYASSFGGVGLIQTITPSQFINT